VFEISKAGLRDFWRQRFSTVLLKSLWKRGTNSAQHAINTVVDAVCTKMKQFFHSWSEIKNIKTRVWKEFVELKSSICLKAAGRYNNRRKFRFNTI